MMNLIQFFPIKMGKEKFEDGICANFHLQHTYYFWIYSERKQYNPGLCLPIFEIPLTLSMLQRSVGDSW